MEKRNISRCLVLSRSHSVVKHVYTVNCDNVCLRVDLDTVADRASRDVATAACNAIQPFGLMNFPTWQPTVWPGSLTARKGESVKWSCEHKSQLQTAQRLMFC